MTKTEHRRRLKELPELSATDRAERNQKICEMVSGLPEWKSARTIALYAASQHEPSLDELWIHDDARIFAFPRVEGTDRESERLQFSRVKSPNDLQVSRWGLREPIPHGEIIDPTTIDFVIVPGVAFTADGARLGRGRGHYDRFLPRLRSTATIVGVCYRERLLEDLPMDGHDVPMRHVISA